MAAEPAVCIGPRPLQRIIRAYRTERNVTNASLVCCSSRAKFRVMALAPRRKNVNQFRYCCWSGNCYWPLRGKNERNNEIKKTSCEQPANYLAPLVSSKVQPPQTMERTGRVVGSFIRRLAAFHVKKFHPHPPSLLTECE